jgi:hypothetical protein
MKRITADVKSGDHSFRLEVWEESPGVYQSRAFDKARQIEFGRTTLRDTIEGMLIQNTMEREKSYLEAALRHYVKQHNLSYPDEILWK